MFILLFLFISISFVYLMGDYPGDDTFIHLKFVKNIVEHNQFTYNLNEPSYTTTSPLWVIFLGITGKIFFSHDFNYLYYGRVIAIIFTLFASIALLYYSKIRFSKPSIIVSLLFLVDPYLTYVINSSMEQPLFIFLGIMGLIFLDLTKIKGNRLYYVLSALFFVLQFFTRPEGIVFILVSVVFLLYSKDFKGAIIISLCYIVFAAPFLFLLFKHFGSFLPITFFVKTVNTKGHLPFTDFVTMKELLRLFAQVYFLPLMVIIIFYFKYSNKKLHDAINENLLLIGIVVFFFVAYFGFLKEKTISSRYLVNFTPIMLFLFVYLIDTMNKDKIKHAIFSFLLIFFISLNILSIPKRINRGPILELPRIEAGKWLESHTPVNSSVFVQNISGIGYVGFYSNRTIYDFDLISKPSEKKILGVLSRSGKLDIAEKIKEYGIDYLVSNERNRIQNLNLELVYKTKNKVVFKEKTPFSICIYKVKR